jgi:gliding motility-associated-like protein
LFFTVVFAVKSQSLINQVINTAGGSGTVGTTQVYYNIGETVINTIQSASNTVTQGFLQPDVLGKYGLTVSTAVNHISCQGKLDGAVILTPTVSGIGSSVSVSYQYFWSPDTLCPAHDCPSVSGINAGICSVTVIATYGTRVDTVHVDNIEIKDNNEPCLIEIYNGVTPNGDGKNDFFYIGNIDQYPKNSVIIFNRWGQEIWRVFGYDNKGNSWKGTSLNNNPAPSGTYFYVIDLGDGKTKLLKGWIELLNK